MQTHASLPAILAAIVQPQFTHARSTPAWMADNGNSETEED